MSNLYIVGTPIGNLDDLTFRALTTLKNVEFIFSEDKRVSRKLLSKYKINSQLVSIYKPNKKLNINYFIGLLNTNDLAFITDAGSPGISDPAGEFVRVARENNHKIITIPGVSALTSAFSVSGIESKGFSFLGFLPKSNKQKIDLIDPFMKVDLPIVIYESPKRIKATLEFIKDQYKINKIFIAKELTKLYETLFFGEVDEAIESFANEKGEFVIIFMNENSEISKSLLEKYDKILIDGYEKGIKGKNLLSLISDLSGIRKGFFYDRWLKIKNKYEK